MLQKMMMPSIYVLWVVHWRVQRALERECRMLNKEDSVKYAQEASLRVIYSVIMSLRRNVLLVKETVGQWRT